MIKRAPAIRSFLSLAVLAAAPLDFAHSQNPPVSGYILDGTRVSESQYPYVARLTYDGEMLCTGTLIGSRYVLTAAHCFFDSRNRRAVGDTEVVARMNGQEYTSTKVSIHPTYRARSSACVEGEIDAAIIELSSDVGGVSSIPLYEGVTPVGTRVTLVGYGTEGSGETGENGSIPPVGLVNKGTTIVQGYGDSPPTKNNASTYYFWKFDPGEANTGSGDSGGPAFLTTGGQLYISGITCGGEGESQFGTYSYNTRADILVSWAHSITGDSPAGSIPRFTAINTQSATVRKSFALTIPVSGTGPISLSASGLPPGLSLVEKRIVGTPTTSGSFNVTISASNANGSATTKFKIVVAAFASVLRITAAELVFDNDPSEDYLAVAGRIGVGANFKPDKARVTVTIGRFSRSFRLDRKGESTGASWSYFDLKGTLRSGRFTKTTVAYELAIDRAALFDELTTLGFPETALAEDGQTVSLPVAISINGVESSVTAPLTFDGDQSYWGLSR